MDEHQNPPYLNKFHMNLVWKSTHKKFVDLFMGPSENLHKSRNQKECKVSKSPFF